MDPSAPRQQGIDSLDLTLNEIRKVETDKGVLKLKLAQQDVYLSPIYLPSFTPIEGPQARRFANTYTRLFVRYPGLEDSKLGTEGMSGGEKFMMGYNIANASADIAMSGFGGIGAISSVQDLISITRTVRAAMVSLSVSFASWEKKRGGPAATPGRQSVQVDSDPAGESGLRAGSEVKGVKIISQYHWSKLNIFVPGYPALCTDESHEERDAGDPLSHVRRQARREV